MLWYNHFPGYGRPESPPLEDEEVRLDMRILSLEYVPSDFRGSVVTIGNFDGIHLGHQDLFRKVIGEARKRQTKSVVITFDPHPQKVLRPENRPFFLLTPLDEKVRLMEDRGIDGLLLIPFTMEFARTRAAEFVERVLWERLQLGKLFVGYDYAFGKNKEGNARYLKECGRQLGFEVEEIGAVEVGGIIVSSTKIRLSILDGDVKLAAKLLGRPYNIYGNVVKGYRRGTDIGIPTANIQSEKVIPAPGVYVILARVEGKDHQGVLNIGYNPTFGNNELSIEVHLLDFKGDIYGKTVELFFIDRLRDEKKFESPAKLKEQIGRDIERARSILGEIPASLSPPAPPPREP